MFKNVKSAKKINKRNVSKTWKKFLFKKKK